ncbi:response regulator transcription factor [Nocardioidaceae bacterium]|nr:response regulator transcription factor [Nocardioidaceae bacterium]
MAPTADTDHARDDTGSGPVRVALVDDYEVVIRGLASLLEPFGDRVRVVELDAGLREVDAAVDVILYDTFAQPRGQAFDWDIVSSLLDHADCRNLLVYSWHVDDEMVAASREAGARGCVGKHLEAEELVEALEKAARGAEVFVTGQEDSAAESDWPGRQFGLTERESEVIALVVQGLSNADIAHCVYLGESTVKTYLRQAYQKMGFTSRTQAVLWGIKHGFSPKHQRFTIKKGAKQVATGGQATSR